MQDRVVVYFSDADFDCSFYVQALVKVLNTPDHATLPQVHWPIFRPIARSY